MAKSELQKTSKEDLKKYKQIFTDYYNAINNKDITKEDIKEKSSEFLKSYNKSVKAAKGIGQVKTKLDWSKIEQNTAEGVGAFLGELNKQGLINGDTQTALASLKIDDMKMGNVRKYLSVDYNDLIKLQDKNKLASKVNELIKELKRFEFKDGMAMWIRIGGQPLYNAANGFEESCKGLHDLCQETGSSLDDIRKKINEIFSSASKLNTLFNTQSEKFKKEMEAEYNKSEAVQNAINKRSKSATLTAIQTAKQTTTSKNVMAVVSLAKKHHPIVLGPIAIKINNCLKKKNF